MFIIFFISLFGLLLVSFLTITIQLNLLRKKIETNERRVIVLYREKINKIPALIEIVRKHTSFDDIFLELIHLHKIAIISNVSSIYDLLESNSRIHREFLFLMKVGAKIHDLHKNGNFLYIRDFIIFYENALHKEIEAINLDIFRYNRILQKRKLTLIWALPIGDEKTPLSL